MMMELMSATEEKEIAIMKAEMSTMKSEEVVGEVSLLLAAW